MVAKSQEVSIQKYSDGILNCFRSSNLHFAICETPFSINITLRKKLINNGNIKIHTEEANTVIEKLRAELNDVKFMNANLIQNKKELETLYEQKEIECYNLTQNFTLKLENVQGKLSGALLNIDSVEKEKDINLIF